jgi:hypothetical protein
VELMPGVLTSLKILSQESVRKRGGDGEGEVCVHGCRVMI